MLPDTGIDDVKKQRNAEYAKHINDPVLSSLKMEGIRLLFSQIFKGKHTEAVSNKSIHKLLVNRRQYHSVEVSTEG
jgi:polynucleotide 5'-kinase involved in rRNA processing